MSNTLRLIVPDWQSGAREAYYYGADLLQWLIPNEYNQKEFRIKVSEPDTASLELENGVYGQAQIIDNVKQAKAALHDNQPDRVVTLGGNCMVSQAPFDYLHGKYGEELGVVWIDTHPDITYPKDMANEHAMVVSNLVGEGDTNVSSLVENPLKTEQFLYVGLQEMLDYEVENLKNLDFDYKIQGDDIYDYKAIQEWIDENNFSKIAIHFDIDVLDPKVFRSTYVAEPGLEELPTVPGRMSLGLLSEILKGLSDNNDVVGMTVAEYMPWDAINLKNALSDLSIFK